MNNEKDRDADDLEPLRLIHEQEAADYAQYKAEAAGRNYDAVTRTDAGGRFTVYGFNQTERASVYVTAAGEIGQPVFERAISDDRTGPNADYFRVEAGPHSDIAARMDKLLNALEACAPDYRLSFIEKQPAEIERNEDGPPTAQEAAAVLLREAEKVLEGLRGRPGFPLGLESAIHDAHTAGIVPAPEQTNEAEKAPEQTREFSAFRSMQDPGRDRSR